MLTLGVDALATFRLARLIVEDSILDRPRNRALAWADVHAPKVSEWAGCYWCCSVALAGGVVVARRAFPRAWGPVAEMLALSAATGIIAERI